MNNSRKRVWLAIAWALVVGLLLAHTGWLWMNDRISPDTDILAMLPIEERDPVLQRAITHMADTAQQRLVVLVGAEDWVHAQRAADAYRAVLAAHPDQFAVGGQMLQQAEQGWLDQFKPQRHALLTADQRQALRTEPAAYWVDAAKRQLYSPFGGIKVGAWQDDPFGLFGGWAQARAQETSVRPSDGRLRVDDGKMHYVLLPVDLRGQAFSLSAQQAAMPVLRQAEQAARAAAPAIDVLAAGLILHAAAAGQQANDEMSTIGWGSLIGILLLMWIAFRSFRPIGLVVLSIGIGCLGALSVCLLLFDRVHLLTLVFGASLIGVAEDYGIHYLCNRLGNQQQRDPGILLRMILPGLTLAMVTTAVAYLALALTPFPGLRQMGVFSAVGLLFAWLTVICWFPVMDRGHLRGAWLVEWYGRSRAVWPQLGRNRTSVIAVLGGLIFCGIGIARLHANDDIRLLQNSPQALLDAQVKVSRLLAAPSLAQFYLVRGATQETVLQREEALKIRLDALVGVKRISGYQALSNWVPSQKLQQADRELVARALFAPGAPLSQVAGQLGEEELADRLRVQAVQAPAAPTPDAFVQTPAGAAWRHLWLGKVDGGYASVVALRDVRHADLPVLEVTADGLPGVQWVDKVGEISSLIERYRHYMGWVVLLSYALVFLLLLARYRRAAWRALAPTIVASGLTLAIFGFMGNPLNLFHVLALLLILGMGVDYGIFLQEHPSRQDKAAWLAVGLSAVSTLLSFGLLGLSKTPALQAFGMTMLLGVTLVWLLAPCFGSGQPKQNGHQT